ncbi:spore coat protein F [Oceanobacillus limi]|uniref:Spore coat protein F n=1 Tax=Oceanobacillus limi TaxID=930131 RepID=A0A1H9YDZ9_9BACI|nr:spore coat protein [Oceanobacillus limi]SES67088.1 spore coat protein F [Oceanobacillus limi]
MDAIENRQPRHLAWHETLEIHELVAFQSIGLMKLKKAVREVHDNKLRGLYLQTIKDLEANINDLLKFYSLAPREDIDRDMKDLDKGFYAGDLLALAKTSVRNYAIAITETATPEVRETLAKHLQKAIRTHANVFNFMYQNGLYPAYDMKKLLENDMNLANKALKMDY